MQDQTLLKPRLTAVTVLCLISLSILLQTGCTQTANSATEEEHLEHHIPEHKPKTYTATIKELDTRMRRLLNDGQEENSQNKRQQLAEIIDWVPEMAADSELKHKDWQEVKKLSTELTTVYQQINLSDIDESLVARYFLLVNKLSQYSKQSETKKFQG